MKFYTFVFSALLLIANGCAASLPLAVEGQALPSLAPMLE